MHTPVFFRLRFSGVRRELRVPLGLRWFLALCLWGVTGLPLRAEGPGAEAGGQDFSFGEVMTMGEVHVAGARMEDFGFRVSPWLDPERSKPFFQKYSPAVDVLLPNTAATKAGMRVGDRIVSADGVSAFSGSFESAKWRKIQEAKWAEFAAGWTELSWVLEVETEGTRELRRLELRIPTKAPRWGGETWQKPEGRAPHAEIEAGPLAERAGQVLDHGINVLLRRAYVRGLRLRIEPGRSFLVGYQWTLWEGERGHRIFVTQQNGTTEIVFEVVIREQGVTSSELAPASGPDRNLTSATTVFANQARAYLTGPDGRLRAACGLGGALSGDTPPEAVREDFLRECAFWVRQVSHEGKRWPFVLRAAVAVEGVEAAAPGLRTPAAATQAEGR